MSVPELLTCQDVMKITGIRSRTTIWRRVQAGDFPSPIDFGAGRIRWHALEITEWVNSRPKRRY
ncbi:AlpA family phage regulatory protein [Novosphingobium sp.]|uniref:helix-turn-helix transcriptional regulator n=1 Tax=Novosphingobium sp. TaxID=1874826 RepID=UPI00334021A5